MPNSYKISARKLLQASILDVWRLLKGNFILVMDDGEIETNHKATAYSRVFWEYHRMYPDTPLLLKHHFANVIKDGDITSSTHREMFDAIVWDVFDTYKSRGVTLETLTRQVYEINTTLYNLKVTELPAYMSSLDIVDLTEILDDPDVVAAKKEVNWTNVTTNKEKNQAAIDNVTNTLKKVFAENRYPKNTISMLQRSKLVRADQVYQGLGYRGYLTDMNSWIFSYPIMTGFVEGMNNFHDVLIESRSAAKALFFSKTPLQEAEFFSRKIQMMCQTLRNLHDGDCGSTHYLTLTLRPERKNLKGAVEFKGDLPVFEGKFYMDEETGQLKKLKKSDKHLIGKSLKFRSIVAGCNHPDPYGVCSTCFSGLSESIPPRTNLGQVCATNMTGKSSQLIISVKHYDGSSVVESITIDEQYTKFIQSTRSGDSYLLTKEMEQLEPTLIIPSGQAIGLSDIRQVEDVRDLSINRVSEIDLIGLMYVDTKTNCEQIQQVPVHIGKRLSSLTYEFLEYVKEVGWTTDANQNYIIDLSNWDYDQPILTLPFKHFNMSDHSKELAHIIERRVQSKKKKLTQQTPEANLLELTDVVNSKLNVNVAVLEVIVLASLITDEESNNHNMPKPWHKRELGVLSAIMPNRSLGPTMGFQGHRDFLTNPSSFMNKGRSSHPMDVLVMPREVVEHLNNQQSR